MSLLLAGFMVAGVMIAMLAYVVDDTEATRAGLAAALARRSAWTSPKRTGTAAGALLRIGRPRPARIGYAPGRPR